MKKLLFILLIIPIGISSACDGKKPDKTNDIAVVDSNLTTPEKATITLTKEEFKKKVMNYETNKEWVFEGDLPCIVDVYADWCGPCRIASPILEEIAQEYKGKINVYKVDIQKDQELAAVFGVQGIPAFLYCPKEGAPRMSSGIGQSKEETKQMFVNAIEEVLLKKM